MEDVNSCKPLQENLAEDVTNEELEEREEQTLLFLDSFDGYLILLDSLTSTLRQGWLELASARQSVGPSRVSSTLHDLKVQSAATTVMLNEPFEESPSVLQPQFMLSKWGCLEERKSSLKEAIDGRLLFEDHNSLRLRHRGPKHVTGSADSTAVKENVKALPLLENPSITPEFTTVDANNRRYKSLSVFGALVSPKLRAAQVSFETALETIVDIANMRSSILSSFSQLQKNIKISD